MKYTDFHHVPDFSAGSDDAREWVEQYVEHCTAAMSRRVRIPFPPEATWWAPAGPLSARLKRFRKRQMSRWRRRWWRVGGEDAPRKDAVKNDYYP